MKYVYPALFEHRDDEISVRFPDLPGCITTGKDMADALCMAQDASAMWLAVTEDKKEQIPPATPLSQIQLEAGTASLVLADTDAWRAQFDSRAVKKTLTLPAWLNKKAEDAGMNFSRILQDALKKALA